MPKATIAAVEPPQPPEPKLITPEEARRIVGVLSPSDMYKRIKKGQFPKPIRISRGSTRFVEAECHEYVRKLIADRDEREAEIAAERAKYGHPT